MRLLVPIHFTKARLTPQTQLCTLSDRSHNLAMCYAVANPSYEIGDRTHFKKLSIGENAGLIQEGLAMRGDLIMSW